MTPMFDIIIRRKKLDHVTGREFVSTVFHMKAHSAGVIHESVAALLESCQLETNDIVVYVPHGSELRRFWLCGVCGRTILKKPYQRCNKCKQRIDELKMRRGVSDVTETAPPSDNRQLVRPWSPARNPADYYR